MPHALHQTIGKTIALVVRLNTDGVETPVQSVVDFLQGAGYTVVFETETASHVGLPDIAAMTAA